eukprot:COSAG01_NODE_7773_length_3063_cov_1431.953104_1_plen_140_part_10
MKPPPRCHKQSAAVAQEGETAAEEPEGFVWPVVAHQRRTLSVATAPRRVTVHAPPPRPVVAAAARPERWNGAATAGSWMSKAELDDDSEGWNEEWRGESDDEYDDLGDRTEQWRCRRQQQQQKEEEEAEEGGEEEEEEEE